MSETAVIVVASEVVCSPVASAFSEANSRGMPDDPEVTGHCGLTASETGIGIDSTLSAGKGELFALWFDALTPETVTSAEELEFTSFTVGVPSYESTFALFRANCHSGIQIKIR